MSAAHYKLDNLTAIVDFNGLQIDGRNDDVMTVKPIDEKFAAFGWNVIVIDGHSFEEIFDAFDRREPARAGRRPSSPGPTRAEACPSWRTRPAGTAKRRATMKPDWQ